MSNYLPIYKQIWTSTKFNQLNANEKLIFLYLLSNPIATNTGIYKILDKQIACDCDISIDIVKSSIRRMMALEMLEYDEAENIFFILKMFKFARGTVKSPKILYKSIIRQKQMITHQKFWQCFNELYADFYEELKEFEEQQEKSINNSSINY